MMENFNYNCQKDYKNKKCSCTGCVHYRMDSERKRMCCGAIDDCQNHDIPTFYEPENAVEVETYGECFNLDEGMLQTYLEKTLKGKKQVIVNFVKKDEVVNDLAKQPYICFELIRKDVHAKIYDRCGHMIKNINLTDLTYTPKKYMKKKDMLNQINCLQCIASQLLASTAWNDQDSFENCVQDAAIESGNPGSEDTVIKEFSDIIKNYMIYYIVRKNIKITERDFNQLMRLNYDLESFDDFQGVDEFVNQISSLD